MFRCQERKEQKDDNYLDMATFHQYMNQNTNLNDSTFYEDFCDSMTTSQRLPKEVSQIPHVGYTNNYQNTATGVLTPPPTPIRPLFHSYNNVYHQQHQQQMAAPYKIKDNNTYCNVYDEGLQEVPDTSQHRRLKSIHGASNNELYYEMTTDNNISDNTSDRELDLDKHSKTMFYGNPQNKDDGYPYANCFDNLDETDINNSNNKMFDYTRIKNEQDNTYETPAYHRINDPPPKFINGFNPYNQYDMTKYKDFTNNSVLPPGNRISMKSRIIYSHPSIKSDFTLSQATHNVLERQRRNDLKLRFSILRSSIPELSKHDKAPKIQILTKAVKHLRQLNFLEQKLMADKELEKQRKVLLMRRINAFNLS